MSSDAADKDEFFEGDNVSMSSIKPIVSDAAQMFDGPLEDLALEPNESMKEPILERYHNACKIGDLKTVKELLESGSIDLSHDWDDVEKVSGLHWASIYNRLSLVRYLASHGADINMKGGDFEATPLHWASKAGYVYIVHCLLELNADASITDKQGYNLLHTSTFSRNVMLVLYVLLTEKLPVDTLDPTGKSALHWASYQGDSYTVESLLKFKANVKLRDSQGFTALHWATVKGDTLVLRALIQHGADVFQKTNDGKNCFDIAKEMNTISYLEAALYECGFNKDGYVMRKYIKNPYHAKAVAFLLPGITLGIIFGSLAQLHFIFALMVAILVVSADVYLLKNFVFPSFTLRVHDAFFHSPLLAGLLSGTIGWIFYLWLFRILVYVKNPIGNFAIFCLFIAVGGLLITLMRSDPGYIPPETDPAEALKTILELLSLGKLDAKNFCIRSWVRIPLRAHYKSASKCLIARYDHYCPWVYNHIGFKNHKLFVFFIVLLEAGAMVFLTSSLLYFDELEHIYKKKRDLFELDHLTTAYHHDKFMFYMFLWVAFQMFWVFILISTQLYECAKGFTDSEYGRWLRKARGLPTHDMTFSSAPDEFLPDEETTAMDEILQKENNQARRLCCGNLCALVGYDRFVSIVKNLVHRNREGFSRLSVPASVRYPNPTDYGWRRNFCDFFLTSDLSAPLWRRFFLPPASSRALLNGEEVDYYKLYKLPERKYLVQDIV